MDFQRCLCSQQELLFIASKKGANPTPMLFNFHTQKLNPGIMKNLFLLSYLSMMILGCNMNPNKEARIQQLESELEQTIAKTDNLEKRVQALEGVNKQLESRMLELEKQ